MEKDKILVKPQPPTPDPKIVVPKPAPDVAPDNPVRTEKPNNRGNPIKIVKKN